MIRTSTLLFLARVSLATRTPTWPTETHDVVEGALYEQFGAYAGGVFAAQIEGCKENPNLPGSNEAAQWIRTGFHDMATADVIAGTGGLDASIVFELDRPENPGLVEFTNTLAITRTIFTSQFTSISDGIALTVLIATGICSDGRVTFPYRVGRVDAKEPGPSGVPEPQDDIDRTVAAFKRTGFTKAEMIGLVACGHTVGAVNGVDFPTIVNVPDNQTTGFYTDSFDTTEQIFDNRVAKEFVAGHPKNPLAFGHNVTMRSDARVFNSDNKEEISRLAASAEDFYKTCSTLMEKMVNTVPKAVKLSDPITPIPVKPMSLFATVNDNHTITFKGTVRLIDQKEPNPNRSVKLFLRQRNGRACSEVVKHDDNACHQVDAFEDLNSATFSAYTHPSEYYPEFKRYNFTTTIPITDGISGFDLQVTDKHQGSPKTTLHTNNGHSYPFSDIIIPQYELSCQKGTPIGFLNLTIAVLDSAKITQLSGSVEVVTTEDPNEPAHRDTYNPKLARKPLMFKKMRDIQKSGYTLYNAQHKWNSDFYQKHYDVEGSDGDRVFRSLFNFADILPECENNS